MKRLMKNRIVLGLGCIIVSLVICFGLTPIFNNALEARVTVVRVNREIKAGEQVTAGMLATAEAGGYNLPPNLVYLPDEAVGKYARADLYKGDFILESKLSDTPLLKNGYLAGLNGENRAISISIKSFAAGLSGKLEPGDIVSVIAGDVGEQRETLLLPELQYIEMIAATAGSGEDSHAGEREAEMELAATITVLASPEQARLLAELERGGLIHVALVYRGSSENARLFLEEQARILEGLDAGLPEETDESGSAGAGEQEDQYPAAREGQQAGQPVKPHATGRGEQPAGQEAVSDDGE